MSLQQTIDQDIKSAMLSKDSAGLRGLRAIKAALLLAKTEKAQKKVYLKKWRLRYFRSL